jgi:Methyltransferase domain
MGFFDFLADYPRYAGRSKAINRLNKRHDFLITPYVSELAGSSVLDLASHDGRWSYALSSAGAAAVVGIEARADLIAQFDAYPAGDAKDRISFVQGDVYEELPKMIREGRTFDVVSVYGLYYHLMDHYGLLKLIKQLGPRLIIIDSEFFLSPDPAVRLQLEPTDNPLNSIEHEHGQAEAPVGFASQAAIEVMANSLGYDVEWADWESVPPDEREGVFAYYRPEPKWKRRNTCALRPRSTP